MVAGVIIGITGYYVATTYQTKVVTYTTTESTTTSLTETSTRTLALTSTILEQTTVTQPLIFTSTALQTTTTTATVMKTSTTTSTVYPIPDNVTVLFIAGYTYSYSIIAGSISYSGSGGGSYNQNQTKSIPISPMFQGETISITVNLNSPTFACNGNVWVQLIVNGQVVTNGSQYCGDGQGIQISYVL
jgi:hypothetical protein